MRASATSKIAPSANLHASQAKANANKADAASPFALLLESTAPSQAAKPAKKDARDSDDHADDKSNAKQSVKQTTHPDDKAGAAQLAVQTKAGRTDKPDSKKIDQKTSDKNVDGLTAKSGSDPQNSQAADPQPMDPQTLTLAPAPMPASPAAIAAAPADTDAARMPIDGAAPTSNDALDVQIAAATAATAQTSTAQASAAAAMAQAPPTIQASAASAQASVATDDADDAAAQIQVAAQARTQTLAKADASAPGTKTDTAKPLKTAANAKTVSADNSKIDDANSGSDKTGDVKANAPQAEAPKNNDMPKPAPQPVQAANNSAAGIATQAPLPTAAPAITQHIHVTAQPVPNMPALAVTIAAKSQSGARQFDIRLDPPELGRVDVRLSIDASGKTSAHLSADQPQTLDLLQKDASVLTRALRDAGLNVSQDGLNFSLRQQAHDGGAGNNSRGTSRAFSATATISIDATVASAAYRARSDGRVDISV